MTPRASAPVHDVVAEVNGQSSRRRHPLPRREIDRSDPRDVAGPRQQRAVVAGEPLAQRPAIAARPKPVAGAEPALARRRQHFCGVRQRFGGQRHGGSAAAIKRGPIHLAHARIHADEDLCPLRHARREGRDGREIADGQDRAPAAGREALGDAGRDAKPRESARPATESDGIEVPRGETGLRSNSSAIGRSRSAWPRPMTS